MFFINSSLVANCFAGRVCTVSACNTESDFSMAQTLTIFKNLATPTGES